MKKLIWKLVIPLTVISFGLLFTKSWYVFVVDGPNVYMNGFPLIWESPGFHTSMSSQIFVVELLFDFLIYFLFWYTMVFLFNRFLFKIKIHTIVHALLILATLFTLVLYAAIPGEVEFKLSRDFDIEVKSTTIDILGL
tara:strand:+ start:50592 stop:51005 length:414 start_codon:yes stop_codon:yes gene_type:complete